MNYIKILSLANEAYNLQEINFQLYDLTNNIDDPIITKKIKENENKIKIIDEQLSRLVL